jgi:hypothetical protein
MEFDGFEIRTRFIGWLLRSVTVSKYLYNYSSLETNIISVENSEEITTNYYYYLRIKRSLIIILSFNLQHKIDTTIRHAG